MTYPCIYAALKRAGHSPAQAHIILLDATRGDGHALRWIALIQRAHV